MPLKIKPVSLRTSIASASAIVSFGKIPPDGNSYSKVCVTYLGDLIKQLSFFSFNIITTTDSVIKSITWYPAQSFRKGRALYPN